MTSTAAAETIERLADVDLYFSEPQTWSDAELADAHAVLSESERSRAARFRFERDRRLYLVAHAMLRRALGDHLSLDPSSIEFEHGTHGRPELARPLPRALRFSLSHSHGMAACALTLERDVGLDVEPLARELPLGVAERCFAPFELEDVLRLPFAQRAARFFTYWTLKEAYVKARGMGLSLPLQRVAFVLSEESVEFRPDSAIESDARDWAFKSFRIAPSHQAALALRGSAPFSMSSHRVGGLGSPR